MRWDRLFDDLESQLALEQSRELEAEVADRTRRERALLDLQARLLATRGEHLTLRLASSTLSGSLVDVGPDWLVIEPRADWPVLVALGSLRSASGLRPGAQTPPSVTRRFALGAALRAVSRDRSTVTVCDVDGQRTTGTIDVVGADHLELAEHAADEPRRSANVLAVHLVPFTAIESVRRLR